MLRVLFQIRLKYLLLFFYAVVFGLAFIVPESFLAASFDSGGVTTGPMTVPFIMALGVGVASISSSDGEGDDSFGMVALCSVGPILAVMILGLIYNVEGQTAPEYPMISVDTSRDIFGLFFEEIPHYMFEMMTALGPILSALPSSDGGTRSGRLRKNDGGCRIYLRWSGAVSDGRERRLYAAR